MKYKRGSIVEVLTTGKVPYQSWRCAQIVSGDRHHYTVRYDSYNGFTDEVNVHRVPKKSIRPCPPRLELPKSCVPGEVVEVFQQFSWKMAIVSMALGGDRFLVRVVGSSQVFEVSKSELRVRLSWQNGEWIVIGKVSRNYEDGRHSKFLKYHLDSCFEDKQRDNEGCFCTKDLHFSAQNKNTLHESRLISSKPLKRGLACCYSRGEVNEGTGQKFILTEKKSKRLRMVATKVDAVANTKKKLYEAKVKRENLNGAYGCSPIGADSVTSSVGSCSMNSYSPYEDTEVHDSSAESFCQIGYQEEIEPSPTSEELAAEIHGLELHAYRCTIEALHASGPLNWEKETMGQSRMLLYGIRIC